MRKRTIGCLALCLAMASLVALGQTRPSTPNNGNGRGGNRNSQQFRQEVLKWTVQYMPNLAKLAVDPPPGTNFFSDAITRFRAYQNARDDKGREKVRTSCRLEDEVFGYVLDLHQAAAEDKPAILEKINQGTERFVKGILEERQNHIEGLRKQIEEEERKLADDQRNFRKLVESRVNSRFLKENSATRPGNGNETPTNSLQPATGAALTAPEQR